jgi:hypothetical protein
VVYATNPAGIYKTTDSGASWANIGPPFANGQTPLYIAIDPFHPDTIYTHIVFTDYRSFDGGKTWFTYILPGVGNNGTSAGAPAFDPLQPGVIYATGGIGIFRSGDGGQTWVRLKTPFDYGGPVSVSPAAPGVIWVRDLEGRLYRSDDQGATFTLLAAAPGFQFVVDPSNPAILLTDGYRSTDGGATWQPLSLARGGGIRFGAGAPGKALAMSQPGYDGFVAKLDPTGQKILFATYLGGFNGANVTGVTTDSAANIYVTGTTASADFPVTAGAVQSTLPAPGINTFAAKFDPAGNLLYATYLPAPGSTFPVAIAVDAQGNTEIAGLTFLSGNPSDCFFTKLSADGSRALVNTNFPHMSCARVAFDGAGNGVAVGTTSDAGFPVTPDALQSTPRGSSDAVVFKFDPSGKVVYATYLGGSGGDVATAVALDSDDNIYVAGNTKSKDFPTTEGAYQTAFTGDCPYPTGYIGVFGPGIQIPVTVNQNAFLTKLDPNGSPVFSTYFGGNCNDSIFALAVDAGGNAWVTGVTDSSTFPLVWPVDAPSLDSYKGFVTRFAASGAWLWRSSFLGSLPAQGLSIDAAGNAYFPVSNGVLKVTPQH